MSPDPSLYSQNVMGIAPQFLMRILFLNCLRMNMSPQVMKLNPLLQSTKSPHQYLSKAVDWGITGQIPEEEFHLSHSCLMKTWRRL